MIKMYFLCCAYRTRIKDHGIIKLRISGLDKQINHSTRICIPIADWDSKKNHLVIDEAYASWKLIRPMPHF